MTDRVIDQLELVQVDVQQRQRQRFRQGQLALDLILEGHSIGQAGQAIAAGPAHQAVGGHPALVGGRRDDQRDHRQQGHEDQQNRCLEQRTRRTEAGIAQARHGGGAEHQQGRRQAGDQRLEAQGAPQQQHQRQAGQAQRIGGAPLAENQHGRQCGDQRRQPPQAFAQRGEDHRHIAERAAPPDPCGNQQRGRQRRHAEHITHHPFGQRRYELRPRRHLRDRQPADSDQRASGSQHDAASQQAKAGADAQGVQIQWAEQSGYRDAGHRGQDIGGHREGQEQQGHRGQQPVQQEHANADQGPVTASFQQQHGESNAGRWPDQDDRARLIRKQTDQCASAQIQPDPQQRAP